MHQMTGILVSLGLICAAFVGCNRSPDNRPDVGGPNSLHTWSNDGESGAGGTVFRVGTLFAIWTNSPNGGGGTQSGNLRGVAFHGQLTMADQGQVTFSGQSGDGRTGTAIINGKTYDLKNGSLFLVATDDDGCRVQQLNRDLSDVKYEVTELKNVAESDTEIVEFFAGDETEAKTP